MDARGAAGPVDHDVDVLVLGGGVAGLSAALGLAGRRRVMVAAAGDGSTRWAQGGVAAAVEATDDPVDHAADTVAAGVDLCDPRALTCLVEEGPGRVADLIGAGANFDRTLDGRLATSLEGGHHRRRVVHAGGDATGAEVARTLEAAAATAPIERLHDATAVGLLLGDGPAGRAVCGAVLRTGRGLVRVRAAAVVLATGGLGHLYGATTNPVGVTGDGLALALLAGATLTDLEFVQFHPTALWTGARSGQLPLVSEALRGDGAVLRDDAGRPFMAGRHPLADLAPRDVVARANHEVAAAAGRPHVWLDATGVDEVARHFPTIAAACNAIGVDPARDLIPVRPAEHFLCGGVATDRWGATDVPGLFAVGEVAATGVHGANRLASNSLLEGLVFGRRVATRLTLDLPPRPRAAAGEVRLHADPPVRARVQRVLSDHVGVVRDADGLAAAAAALAPSPGTATDPAWLVGRAVVAAATARRESRGCHYRTDAPATLSWWRRRVAVRLDADGVPSAAPATAVGAAA